MGNYYGLDWIAKAMILAAIYYLPTKQRRAEWLFILCNVLTVTVAFMCHPTMWGGVVGDVVFALMHMRNLRCLKKQSSTPAATTTPPRSGSTTP